MTKCSKIALSLLLPALLIATPLFARGDLSLDQAVERARENTGGRVISAETKEKEGRRVHNIRILTNDGKVRRLRFDADTERRSNNRR